jgi:hypothetical protein
MDMRDKDLDKLFHSALNDYEMDPSPRVWAGITEELDATKRKKAWLPFLSVAAGVILLVTAGVLFIPKEVKPKKTDNLVAVRPPVKPIAVAPVAQVVQPIAAPNKKPATIVIAPVSNLASNKIKTHKPAIAEKPAVKQPVQDVVTQQDAQPVLAVARPGQQLVKPVVPDVSTPIMQKHTDDAPVIANVPTVAPTQQVAAVKTAAPVKKHKIRSLGDVFNVMISAVDKRKDKIIEFSNTDEDDATITGLNLGIIKVKKEK